MSATAPEIAPHWYAFPRAAVPHVEFRAGDNSSNPHLFLAALLAAGLDGLARDLDPGAAGGDWDTGARKRPPRRGLALLPQSAPGSSTPFKQTHTDGRAGPGYRPAPSCASNDRRLEAYDAGGQRLGASRISGDDLEEG